MIGWAKGLFGSQQGVMDPSSDQSGLPASDVEDGLDGGNWGGADGQRRKDGAV